MTYGNFASEIGADAGGYINTIIDGAGNPMFTKTADRFSHLVQGFPPVEQSMSPANRWCISVIDETYAGTPTLLSTQRDDYITFRNTWPNRPLKLLVPQPSLSLGNTTPTPPGEFWTCAGTPEQLYVPQKAVEDRAVGLFSGPTRVNRDGGSIPNRSDWFTLLGMSVLGNGSKVGLFIDNSGSMNTAAVQASYDKFLLDCQAAGITVITVTNNVERYIQPFINMSGI